MKTMQKLISLLAVFSLLAVCCGVLTAGAFTAGTATMPETFTVIDDFENGMDKWQAIGTTTVALSSERGYGASGSSLHVSWDGSTWRGAKTKSISVPVGHDGLALWLYVVKAVPGGKTFAVNVRQESNVFEYKVPTTELTAGEHILTIPWTSFTAKQNAFDRTAPITQVELTCNNSEGDYFLDQVGMYKGNAQQSEYIAATLKLADNRTVLYDFETGAGAWAATNKAAIELSGARGYGPSGKSLHVSQLDTGWSGAKTDNQQHIMPAGNGLTFWAYAEKEVKGLVVKLLQNGTGFEKKIDLAAGENIVRIEWSEFQKNGKAIDTAAAATQMEFTRSPAGDYYVDDISVYYNFIPSTLDMVKNFTLIEGFDFESGITPWVAGGKATVTQSDARGFGTTGHSLHVSWTESGWSGAKTSNGQKKIALSGDGVAFWCYTENDVNNFITKVLVDGVAYEKGVKLTKGENIVKLPWGAFYNKSKNQYVTAGATATQLEFTYSGSTGSYYVDQIGTYTDPVKPAVSTALWMQSYKSSSSLIGGNGKGNAGGHDPVRWKIYSISGDERFASGCHFVVDDIGSGRFFFYGNNTGAGDAKVVDISSAADFGTVRFWIKSTAAGRSMRLALMNKDGVLSDFATFTVTQANKWQEIVISLPDLLSDALLTSKPNYLKEFNRIVFDGAGFGDGGYQRNEEFRIAGLTVYDSVPVDRSALAELDTEPTQPADDGSYATDGVIGAIYPEKKPEPYSGNSGIGKIEHESVSDLGNVKAAYKWVVGEGIADETKATKGMSFYFSDGKGTGETVDISNARNGYLSFWVRGSRAGATFSYLLFDDTSNDAKSSIVRWYTIRHANTWEEVRVPLTAIILPGAVDSEYIASFVVRTLYGVFNWRYAYTDEAALKPGDVLEFAAIRLTEGKPLDPYAKTATPPVLSGLATDLTASDGSALPSDLTFSAEEITDAAVKAAAEKALAAHTDVTAGRKIAALMALSLQQNGVEYVANPALMAELTLPTGAADYTDLALVRIDTNGDVTAVPCTISGGKLRFDVTGSGQYALVGTASGSSDGGQTNMPATGDTLPLLATGILLASGLLTALLAKKRLTR